MDEKEKILHEMQKVKEEIDKLCKEYYDDKLKRWRRN